MTRVSRRAALAGLAAIPLARPGLLRAQDRTGPVIMGLLSDISGPYRDNGGPASKVAVELAAADFGGSVLGRPLQVIQGDDQNKPDIASALAREWIDAQGVSVLMDGASSAAAFAIQQVARDKKRNYLITSPISSTLTGKLCSPYGFHFVGNTYSLTKAVSETLTKQGGTTWFIIAVDYEVGHMLQASMEQFVTGAGGRVIGAVKSPIGATDYSSQLLQARASGAKVIGLGLGGGDLQNCVKQAYEFGLTRAGQRLATPALVESDVLSIGIENCRSLFCASSFYWNDTPESRAFAARMRPRFNRPPNYYQAAAYSAALHWLKAVAAAGTLDADAVSAKMRDLPVNDFFNKDVRIQANGAVPVTMDLYEVKPEPVADRWDVFDHRGSLPSPTAYPNPAETGCPLVRS